MLWSFIWELMLWVVKSRDRDTIRYTFLQRHKFDQPVIDIDQPSCTAILSRERQVCGSLSCYSRFNGRSNIPMRPHSQCRWSRPKRHPSSVSTWLLSAHNNND
eukprot:scaffold284_cov133-Skeletonema_menzelii.AAC.4